MLIALLVALFVIGADQVTKMLIVQAMANEPDHDIPVIEGILHLHYAHNTGAAFSMLEGMQWIFICASIIATIAIIVFLAVKKVRVHWFGLAALGLIMGGALGNLADRIHTADHSVIDFIYVKVINFAVFNVADSAITVGAILLCIYILFFHEKLTKKHLPKEPDKVLEPDSGQAQG
jgi:signal peptidase II